MASNQQAREGGWWQRSAQSYTNQQGGVTVPESELGGIVEILLGFQPLGIAVRGSRIAIADYFGPAICLAEFTRDESSGLHLTTQWVRGARCQERNGSIRMFPDVVEPSGANRLCTVNFGPGNTLLFTRNVEPELFTIRPLEKPSETWSLEERKINIPRAEVVHSVLLQEGIMFTVECRFNGNDWSARAYEYGEQIHDATSRVDLPKFVYGIGSKPGDNALWFVTDFRAEVQHGLYRLEPDANTLELVIPDIEGTGVAFLADGSAFVTRYGQGHPGAFNGVPGALLYIPASLIS